MSSDFTVCPHGAGCQRPTEAWQQRLDELMRRCREEGHDLSYQDLLALRGDSTSDAERAIK